MVLLSGGGRGGWLSGGEAVIRAGTEEKLKRSLTLSAVGLLLTATALLPADAQDSLPVRVGGEDVDACGATGAVKGLDPNGDNFLAVRVRPTSRAREVAKLHEGDKFYMCDHEGKWIGIIWGSGTCGVTTTITKRGPYRGGCQSGWVYEDYVELIAG